MLQPYDREELYRKVWEQPLSKVAEEYGVSAVALGKVARGGNYLKAHSGCVVRGANCLMGI